MTRKTAPRAPVCGSDTLGGCKDATPGLREDRGRGRGGGQKGDEPLEALEGEKRGEEPHTYRLWGDLQVCNKIKKVNMFEQLWSF